ncbi:hypothetical protein Tco_1349036 [Tanacetum coccineum]
MITVIGDGRSPSPETLVRKITVIDDGEPATVCFNDASSRFVRCDGALDLRALKQTARVFRACGVSVAAYYRVLLDLHSGIILGSVF